MPDVVQYVRGVVSQFYYSALNTIRPRSTSDRLVLGSADQGTTQPLSVDAGTANSAAIVTRGYMTVDGISVTANATCIPGVVLTETANDFTCSAFLAIASGTLSNAAMYVKNNQFVIAFICGANGQMRYLSIELNGFTCTWSARSVGP